MSRNLLDQMKALESQVHGHQLSKAQQCQLETIDEETTSTKVVTEQQC